MCVYEMHVKQRLLWDMHVTSGIRLNEYTSTYDRMAHMQNLTFKLHFTCKLSNTQIVAIFYHEVKVRKQCNRSIFVNVASCRSKYYQQNNYFARRKMIYEQHCIILMGICTECPDGVDI